MLDDDIIEQFTSELRHVSDLLELKTFVQKWKKIWEVKGHGKSGEVEKVDKEICEGCLTEDDLHCIRLSFEPYSNYEVWGIARCEHVETKMCVGMEIRMPWSLTLTMMVSAQYGVPTSVAFHQLFCDDPKHATCFY